MVTRKLARNGMRGRKKTTTLLVLVLTFTFLFIVSAILLETSMTKTKQQQRQQLYGGWHTAYMEASPEICEQLAEEPEVSRMVKTKLLGENPVAGMVGTINQDFVDMGNLTLVQGRLPEAEDEILLEDSVVDRLGIDEPLGENMELEIQRPLVVEDLMASFSQEVEDAGADSDKMSGFRRILNDKEIIGRLELNLKSQYCGWATNEQAKDVEYIEKNGTLYERQIDIKAEYKIVGVIQSYSAFWDIGTYAVPNVFLSEVGGNQIEEALHITSLVDLSELSLLSDVFLESDKWEGELRDKLAKKYEQEKKQESDSRRVLRRNQYAYPESGTESEGTITLLVVAVIFVVAFCAVLQIFLTQIKRRTRKIALLKSVGSTTGQIVGMLFWEGIYLLCYSMPPGILAGFGVGWGAVQFLQKGMGMDVDFHMDLGMLLLGILLGCGALFAGMTIPVLKAVHVPLVGAITVSTKNRRKKSIRKRRKTGSQRKPQRLTYDRISKTHERLNWKSRVLTGVISVVTLILVLSAIYLGYLSFAPYREIVEEQKRPNYVLKAAHGYDARQLESMAENLEDMIPESHVEAYQRLNKVGISYEGMDESSLITAYKKYLPRNRYEEFIGSEPTGTKAMRGIGDLGKFPGSLQTTLFSVDPFGELGEALQKMVTVGNVDQRSFDIGESVILAVPLYEEGTPKGNGKENTDTVQEDEMFSHVLEEIAGYQLSYDKEDEGRMVADTTIEPGDKIWLSVERQEMTATPKPVSYDSWEVQVGGIIYYTPGEKRFPFFKDKNGFVVFGSPLFMKKLSIKTSDDPMYYYTEEQFEFVLTQCPDSFGETYMNVYTNDRANAVEMATQVMKYGKGYGMEFVNYNEENWNLYYKALNTALILGVFGAASVLIALVILWNIHMSSFEQERGRLGVLQALGVTNRKISLRYLGNGVKTGIFSLTVAHICLGVILLFTGGNFYELAGYPWILHMVVCLGYVILVTVVGCGPIRELKKHTPQPAIILADEPTGNLDDKTTGEVIAFLKKSARRFHQTIVLITHDLELAKQADVVITISDGQILSVE